MWRRQKTNPDLFPRWVQVVRLQGGIKKETTKGLVDDLSDNMQEIKEMLEDQTKQTEMVLLYVGPRTRDSAMACVGLWR